jgi:uncharacterized protein
MIFDAKLVLIAVFLRLRRAGFALGIAELLDCLSAVQHGWGITEEEVKRTVRLLWCNSISEMAEFNAAWSALVLPEPVANTESDSSRQGHLDAEPRSTGEQLSTPWEPAKIPIKESRKESLSPIPIRTAFNPIARSSVSAPDSYWPVSRRFMNYIWRYLRWPVSDGPMDVLNVGATVENAARQGFYFSPVFKRRTRNYAHLVMLVDRGGSMVPFHRFAQGLVETAQEESDLGRFEVFYFHNVVGDYLYADSFLTKPQALDLALDGCGSDTSVLLVSDAGAARGQRKRTRIRLTADFLFQLRARTQLIAWLNPLPEERWLLTSAQTVSHFVPMFQMDEDGLSNAVDVLRGQPVFPRAAQ